MQNEIKEKQPLLNEKGHIINPGFAKTMLYEYKRDLIKAPKFKIKEWDYYLVSNEEYGFAFTIADNGYLGFISVAILDFKTKDIEMFSNLKFFPLGKFRMPETTVVGDVVFKDKKIEMSYLLEENKRIIQCSIPNFKKGLPFKAEFILTNEPAESMVIATPFQYSKTSFYFNQKINCFKADGVAVLGEKEYKLNDANAVLDWGRGVWTYDNTWYWGSASGKLKGVPFGFNIGYGFGDTSKASENMIFYDGKAHKFEQVRFNIPREGKKFQFMKEWTIESSDNRLNLVFKPYLDRFDKISLLLLVSDQHQVFGTFSGYAVLDDGKRLDLKDFHGFAEMVHNRW